MGRLKADFNLETFLFKGEIFSKGEIATFKRKVWTPCSSKPKIWFRNKNVLSFNLNSVFRLTQHPVSTNLNSKNTTPSSSTSSAAVWRPQAVVKVQNEKSSSTRRSTYTDFLRFQVAISNFKISSCLADAFMHFETIRASPSDQWQPLFVPENYVN